MWRGSTHTYGCGIPENIRPKRRKRTCWEVHEILPRTAKLWRLVDLLNSWELIQIKPPRISWICKRPPAHTSINKNVCSLEHINKGSACYRYTKTTGSYGHMMNQKTFWVLSEYQPRSHWYTTATFHLWVSKCGWLPAVAPTKYDEREEWVRTVWGNDCTYCMNSYLLLNTTAWFYY